MTNETILKYQKKARYVANKKGYPELADDFVQELLLQFIQTPDRGATVDQLFIDYLRVQYGRTGTPGGDAKSFALHTMGHIDETRDIAASPGEQRENGRFDFLFTGKQLELYTLRFIDELTEKEIGKIYDVTESRICQCLKVLKREIQDYCVLREALDRMEWDPDYTKLSVDWIRL